MEIWNGNSRDITDFSTDKFLKVNSCGFQNAQKPFTVLREKGRQDYHFLVITGGFCSAVHNGKEYSLKPGSIAVYEPFERQEYTFDKSSASLWCHFSGTAVKEIFESCGIKSGIYSLRRSKSITDAFSALIGKFNLNGNEKFAVPCLLELIYKIGDGISEDGVLSQSEQLSLALTYINANYNKPISLGELAKISGYSVSRFSHLFSEVTGTTPVKYQNSIRLKLACEILSSTALSVSDIAYSLGFSDPLYFSRIFKKEYGVSPSEYRKSL